MIDVYRLQVTHRERRLAAALAPSWRIVVPVARSRWRDPGPSEVQRWCLSGVHEIVAQPWLSMLGSATERALGTHFAHGGRSIEVIAVRVPDASPAWRHVDDADLRAVWLGALLEAGDAAPVSVLGVGGVPDATLAAWVATMVGLGVGPVVLEGPNGGVEKAEAWALRMGERLGASARGAVAVFGGLAVGGERTSAVAAVTGLWSRLEATWGALGLCVSISEGRLEPGYEPLEWAAPAWEPRRVIGFRSSGSRGVTVWGAATLAGPDHGIHTLRVQRTLECAIRRGLTWLVFEPMPRDGWSAIEHAVGHLLDPWFAAGLIQAPRHQEQSIRVTGADGVIRIDIAVALPTTISDVVFDVVLEA